MSVNYKGKKLIGNLYGAQDIETCALDEIDNGSLKVYYTGNFGEGDMYVKATCTEILLSKNYIDSMNRNLNLQFSLYK